jgi:hypothetical protein
MLLIYNKPRDTLRNIQRLNALMPAVQWNHVALHSTMWLAGASPAHTDMTDQRVGHMCCAGSCAA